MPKVYSLDLREKVVAFIAGGSSKREASRVFKLGEATIYRWVKREEEGNLKAKKRSQYSSKVDTEKLKAYVKKHPDHTLKEIGAALELGKNTVFVYLRRLNITRKKRPHGIKSVMRKNA